MATFSLTPMGAFPPPAPEDFPVGTQYENSGTVLGDRSADTINFRRGLNATRGLAENANVITIDANVFDWIEVTASRLLDETDLGNGLKVDSATDVVITVPGDTQLNIQPSDGAVSLLLMQQGAGTVTVVGQSGVQILSRAALSQQIAGQYGVISLIYSEANTWVVCGDLAAA